MAWIITTNEPDWFAQRLGLPSRPCRYMFRGTDELVKAQAVALLEAKQLLGYQATMHEEK